MSLIGWPLQTLAFVSVIVAVASLAIGWSHLKGWWRVARVPGVIVCQLLLVFAAGLWVNRSEDFYPSWAALFGDNPPKITTQQQPEALLANWLRGQRARGARSGLSFEWRGAQAKVGTRRARRAVCLPRASFVSSGTVLPVVFVVVGPDRTANAAGCTPTRLAPLVPAAPAVVVLVRSQPLGPSPQFAAQLPSQLTTDLRTAASGWGIIDVDSATPAALHVFTRDPAYFGALGLLAAGPTTAATKAHDIAVADTRPLLMASRGGIAAMLKWIYGQLPPALTPPLVVAPGAGNGS